MTQLSAKFEKRYPQGATIQADLICDLDRFSITALYGPSGCGKTTILRCLAGLEIPEQGTIHAGATCWLDAQQKSSQPPQQRDIGFLFQEYALFPHLTVSQNICYGLTGLTRPERTLRVDEMLARFGLQGLGQRYPNQISGGQKQRVALARVLIRKPRLLLLDEPLSALDIQTRDQVRLELRRLLADFGIPVILVTHDRIEALTLADQLIVLDQGRILQADVPDTVYRRPNSIAVAKMMGVETILAGQIIERRPDAVTLTIGGTQIVALATTITTNQVTVCIRAEDVQLKPVLEYNNDPTNTNRFPVQVQSIVSEGPLVRVTLDGGIPMTALVTRTTWQQLDLAIGDKVTATLDPAAVHLIGTT